MNVDPSPGVLCAVMVPPWRSAILRQIASPMPVPSYFPRPCSRSNIVKMRSAYFSSKPMPLSATRMRHVPSSDRRVDRDDRRHVVALKLQRVAGEVLQQLPHLQRIGVDDRQRADVDVAAGLVRAHLEIVRHFARHRFRDRQGRTAAPFVVTRENARQVVDQHLHPLRGRAHPLDVVACLRRQRRGVFRVQQFAEGLDLPQRLLQVVRGDVREVFELAVALLEVLHGAPQLGLGAFARADVARDHHRAVLHIFFADRRDGDADVDVPSVAMAEDALLVADRRRGV